MPFKSKAQQGYLYANEPEVAKEFEKKTPKSHVDPYREENKLYGNSRKNKKRKASRIGIPA